MDVEMGEQLAGVARILGSDKVYLAQDPNRHAGLMSSRLPIGVATR